MFPDFLIIQRYQRITPIIAKWGTTGNREQDHAAFAKIIA
jgi:hypothetical protein